MLSAAKGCTSTTRSPSTPKRSRLVARTFTVDAASGHGARYGAGGVKHVLAVVEDDQQPPPVEGPHQGIAEDARSGSHAQRRRHHGGHVGRAFHRGQLDPPHALREGVLNGDSGGEGETSLSDASRPRERHHPGLTHELLEPSHLRFPSDQPVEGDRQASRRCVLGLQWRELRRQSRPAHAEQPVRRGDAPQPMLPKIDEPDVVAERAVDDLRRRRRHHDLAPVPRRHQTGGEVDRRAEIVAVALNCLTGVDADTHGDRRRRRPRLGAKPPLSFDGRRHRVGRPRESGAERVAPGRKDAAARAGDRLAQDAVVTLQSLTHGTRVLVPQASRVDDVGEEKRDRSRRSCSHDAELRALPPMILPSARH